MKVALLLLATLFTSNLFALDFTSSRNATQSLFKELASTKNICDLTPISQKLYLDILDIEVLFATEIGRSNRDITDEKLKEVRFLLYNARVSAAQIDTECSNFKTSSPSKLLVELYLTHADTQLMIIDYGVGPDLKRVNK